MGKTRDCSHLLKMTVRLWFLRAGYALLTALFVITAVTLAVLIVLSHVAPFTDSINIIGTQSFWFESIIAMMFDLALLWSWSSE